MSNFLLFCKRTRVITKYRFFAYRFRFLKFLSKFIPYFKQMYISYINEEKLLYEFNLILKNYLDESKTYKNCKINDFEISKKILVSKSLTIQYDVSYLNIDFYILLICEDLKFRFELTLYSINKDYSKITFNEDSLLSITSLLQYFNEIDNSKLTKKFKIFDEFFEKKENPTCI